MKWQYTPPQDAAEWHVWFAWRPVHTANRWVWLECVERRSHLAVRMRGDPGLAWVYAHGFREWEYRE